MAENTALAERTERIESPIYGEIMPVAAIQQNIARVQTLKKEVLKEGVDFGVIPGTPKESLYKPGAELVNLMFGVSVDPDPAALREEEGVDDVGVPFYRCTVRMVLKTRSGVFLGASYGSASSLEEKYKWRRATGPKEFAATPESRRRTKFGRKKSGDEYEVLQVRTEVEDIKNTILQMAMKRAEVSGTRRVHALSGMFGQDLEDLPEEIRESIVEGEVIGRDDKQPIQSAQRKSQQQNGAAAQSPSQPAGEPTPAQGGQKSPIGKIKSVEEKPTDKNPYYAIRLNTSFGCTTWSKTLADQAAEHQKAERVVKLVTKQEDSKYPPTLKAIEVVEREPGQEG